jgi:hypothetical protein
VPISVKAEKDAAENAVFGSVVGDGNGKVYPFGRLIASFVSTILMSDQLRKTFFTIQEIR